MNADTRREDSVAAACLALGLQLSSDRQRDVAEILRSLEAAQDIVDAWLRRRDA
jgi:hypothetical protein